MTKKPNEPLDPTDTNHPLYDRARDPTHPFYEEDEAEGAQNPHQSDESEYKVGPGHPPKQHTWRKGERSPNPKGRPRKIPSMKPDLKKALESALNEKAFITVDKKKIVLTKAVLGIQQLVNQYAKGDRYARRDLFQYAAQLGVDLQAKELIAEALGINEQAIVDAFLRRQQQPSVAAAPAEHVKAPPDLIDDDVTKSPPNEVPAVSSEPSRPAKMPVEPVLDEHGKPLDASDPRYVRAQSERRLAWEKKNQGGS
jgi:Family of unknown function (DUF5681)